MKLSSNFTLYGLNVKAIQAYLKDQGKCQRGVRISRRGDMVYIMTAYIGFKIPVMLYLDIVQPATFRECPEDGVTIVSGQYGYEVEKNAPDLTELFKNHAPTEKAVERTPFLQELPTGKKKTGLARLYHVGPVPILINSMYDCMVDPAQFIYHGKASGYSPVYATNTQDPVQATIAFIFLPIRPTDEVKALCNKMFSE